MIRAANNNHIDVVDHLLSQSNIDINCKNVLIQNSYIENCDIAGIECFDNAVLIAKKNEIINIKKYAFFVYTSSYLNGSSNICKNIEIAFVKLFKGGGEFVNNNIEI